MIIIIFIFVIILICIIEKISVMNKEYSKPDINNYKDIYRPKRYITTLNELNFYKVLIEIAKELNLLVFAQVSLYAILETKNLDNKKLQRYYFNKIKAKSIDFVLVDPKDCRVKLCIELDDSTHKRKNRKKRDEFINKLFRDLEINLYRIPVYPVYYKNTIKQQIQAEMKEQYYVD